ncbi:hypothetical protein ACROYT_G023460 [Oculina patagonica]
MEEVVDDVHVSSSSREVNEADSSEGSHLESSDAETPLSRSGSEACESCSQYRRQLAEFQKQLLLTKAEKDEAVNLKEEALDDRCKQLESELQQKQLEINRMQLLMRNQPRLYRQPQTPQNTSMEQPLSHLSLLGAAALHPGTPTQSLPSLPAGTTSYGHQIPPEVIDQIEVLKQQLRVYADDFATEREDRKRNQSEKEKLKEELDAVKDQLGTLEQQRRQSQLCSGDSLVATASSNGVDGNLEAVLQDQLQQQYALEDGVELGGEHNGAIFIPRDDHQARWLLTLTVTQPSLQEERHAPNLLGIEGNDRVSASNGADMPSGNLENVEGRPLMERVLHVEDLAGLDVTGIDNAFLARNSIDKGLVRSLLQGSEDQMTLSEVQSGDGFIQPPHLPEPHQFHPREHSCSCCVHLQVNARSQSSVAGMLERCRPDPGHDVCCVCLQGAFPGCLVLPCSHKVHAECLIAMIIGGE